MPDLETHWADWRCAAMTHYPLDSQRDTADTLVVIWSFVDLV